MASETKSQVRTISSSIYLSHVVAIAATGLLLVLAALADWELSQRRDVVLGVSTRNVLWMAGSLHLALFGALPFIHNRTTQSILMLWLGLNHILYRTGLSWLNASTPLVILRVIGMKVGVHARVLDTAWKWFMAYLVVSSLVVLVLEWRRARRQRDADYLAQWQVKRKADSTGSTGG